MEASPSETGCQQAAWSMLFPYSQQRGGSRKRCKSRHANYQWCRGIATAASLIVCMSQFTTLHVQRCNFFCCHILPKEAKELSLLLNFFVTKKFDFLIFKKTCSRFLVYFINFVGVLTRLWYTETLYQRERVFAEIGEIWKVPEQSSSSYHHVRGLWEVILTDSN
jgi:hypothetical protein